jgi:plastocyanin
MRVPRLGSLLASLVISLGGLMPVGAAAGAATQSMTSALDPGTPAEAAPLVPQFLQANGASLSLAGHPLWLKGASIYGTSNPGGTVSASQVLAWAAAAHLNTIRLVNVFDERGLDDGAPYDEANWIHVDQLLADISAHRALALLDLSAFRNHLVNRDIRVNGWQANCLPNGDRAPVDYDLIDPYRVGLASEWQAFIDFVTSRLNTVTGVQYADDPTIAVISLAGEPQPPASAECGKATGGAELTEFYRRTLEMLRIDDPNHLRSSGGLIHTDWQQLYGHDSGIDGQAIFALADNTLPALHTYPPGYENDGTPIDYQTPVLGPYATGLGKPWFTEEFGWTQDVGDAVRASRYRWLYDEQQPNGSDGALFWNLGPEVAGGSHDANPSTPLTWNAIVAPLERVSVSSTGAQGDSHTYSPDVSATGRYVVFSSYSTTLVAGDTNDASDVFIRDRQLGTTQRLSVTSSGGEANGDSFRPSISADGRYVAFVSRARNLDVRDSNSGDDVYVHDRQNGDTALVSVTLSDTGSNQVQTAPSISGDGRFIAFTTGGGDIVDASEPSYGVYIRDRSTGTSELASVGTAGQPVNGFNPSISDDGQHVAFDSGDSGIDPLDANGFPDVFVRDREQGMTQLVSRGPSGESGNGESSYARISSDGQRVAFMSYAFNWGFGRPDPGVYLRDLQAGTTVRVDVAPGGTPTNIDSGPPDLSGDGRYVIFRSTGADLAPGPTNGWFETYVADLVGGTLERISTAADGGVQSGGSYDNAISANGSIAVITSDASNLVADDTNGTVDAFARRVGWPIATPGSVPRSPTSVTAAAGDGQASVSWAAPASDGGSPISSYTVSAAPGGETATVAGDVLTTTVTSLTNGTPYTFTVTATNDVGTGPASDPSDPVTPQAGAPAPQTTEETIPSGGGTATTDPSNTGPTPSDPVTTSVTVPATASGGSVTIAETAVSETPPTGGYQFLGQQIDITSTASTSDSNPLTIVFTIDSSAIRVAFGLGPTDALPAADQVDVTRAEGAGAPAVIGSCTALTPLINPDPCVSSRQYLNGGDDLQITILTGTASHWNTAIKPVAVTVTNSGYSPKAATVAQGGIVVWTFAGSKLHSVTDNLKLGPAKAALFNSGPLTSGRYGYIFRAAGTYTYGSTVKGDPGSFAGSIGVPVRVSPTSGGTTTTFTITWSSVAMPGYVFDVQYRFMKAGTKSWSGYKSWQTGVSPTNANFIQTLGKGSYAFSARLRNATTGMASLWSPEAAIVIR